MVIVTGAGIGENVAMRFAQEGYHAVLYSRSNQEGLGQILGGWTLGTPISPKTMPKNILSPDSTMIIIPCPTTLDIENPAYTSTPIQSLFDQYLG